MRAMHYRGLKQAARRCLRDSHTPYRRLTLLFLLCFLGLSMLCDLISFYLERRLEQETGFGTIALQNQADLFNVLSMVGLSVVGSLWNAGYSWFALRISRGQPASFGDFFQGFRLVSRVLAVVVLQSILIAAWSMLFLLPGLVAMYRYRMAVFAVLDDPDLGPLQALSYSSRLTYGHKMELLMLDLRFFWYYGTLFLVQLAVMAYNYGFLPVGAYTDRGYWTIYILYQGVMLLVETLALAYVTATQAHAFNWLQTLDRDRMEDLRRSYGGGYPM